MEKRVNKRRIVSGVVVSDKMDKTCVVQVDFKRRHPLYNKLVKYRKKFKAHDEKNEAKMGDVVNIRETRPLSKDKRWVLIDVTNSEKLGANA